MRFKAQLRHDRVLQFKSLFQLLDKVTPDKIAIMHMTEEHLQFIIKPVGDETQVFAKLNAKVMFSEYRIESRAENQISCEIHLESLEHVLKSTTKATSVTLKLTKKSGIACMSFEAELHDHQLVQDVPIRLLSAVEMESYSEPLVSTPDCQFEFPDCKGVRTVVERMKSFDKFLDFEVNGDTLIISVCTDLAVMKTYYRNIKLRTSKSEDDEEGEKSDGNVKIKLDIKKFSKLLHVDSIHPENIICCITQSEALILHVILDRRGGSVTYYLPILDILLEEEDRERGVNNGSEREASDDGGHETE